MLLVLLALLSSHWDLDTSNESSVFSNEGGSTTRRKTEVQGMFVVDSLLISEISHRNDELSEFNGFCFSGATGDLRLLGWDAGEGASSDFL